jgi:hypothetical protein
VPKLTARVPSYCRHKRSGLAVVYIDGGEIPLGTFNSAPSREKYNAIIGEWLANGRALPVQQEEVTVLHVIAKFLKHAEVYYRTPAGKVTEEVPTRSARRLRRPMFRTAAELLRRCH